MDHAQTEAKVAGELTTDSIEHKLSDLAEMQLALIGGGIGDTVI